MIFIIAVLFLRQLNISLSNNPINCILEGDRFHIAGLAMKFRCTHSYSDGGKACDSSDECESSCLILPEKYCPKGTLCLPSKEEVTKKGGVCKQDDNPFGCYGIIEDFLTEKEGIRFGIVCTD